jgi:hypothetical protein
MSNTSRYLTKSRFKLGLECPTKLYYTKNAEYNDNNEVDPFMQALARGGYQVGEMAKYKYCDDPQGYGITVETLNVEEALQLTQEKLLSHPNIVIAEGAFRYENLFIRADIVVRDGNTIKLIEVKSKSIENGTEFFDKKGKPNTKWQPYLYDIAFQTYVMQKALPRFTIKPYLLLVNKDAVAGRDGLNQLFKVKKDVEGRLQVSVPDGLTSAQIGNFDLLREVSMGEVVERLHTLPVPNENVPEEHRSLENFILWSSEVYRTKQRIWSKPTMACKKCTFVKAQSDKKCGFTDCWSNHEWSIVGKVSAEQLQTTKVTELWLGLGGSTISTNVMKQNVPLLSLMNTELLKPASYKEDQENVGMTAFERRGYQIEAAKNKSDRYVFLKDDFESLHSGWKYPLNMIDFETSVVALPYFKGMSPYETVAFQFSHHILHEDGRVEHFNDFISWEQGEYPNLMFVRALKNSLETNEGSVFRYAAHENTVLNKIKRDIAVLKPDDLDELLMFIDSITEEEIDKKSKRIGYRNMVDMADLVRKVYYSPHAGGSNSIKRILPAIINDCPTVAQRYSQSGKYGRGLEFSSRNFDDHVWIRDDKNRDPYKTLLPLTDFEGVTDIDLFDDLEGVSDGTAAMTAYNKLQWSFIGDAERLALRNALLQYCELDTLAMVMLMQGLMGLRDSVNPKKPLNHYY